MQHTVKIDAAEYPLALSRSAQAYRLHLADQVISVDLKTSADGRAWLTVGERHLEVVIATRGDEVFIHLDGEAHQLRYQHPLDRLAAQGAGSAEDSVRAPMPGSIVIVQVQLGEWVSKGQTLLVMESMKMETTITAPRDGVVEAITYEKGQSFERDALLLSLKAIEATT